ncbi:transglutaminase-like domain-containing protein [Tissierella sp.]|uniref:transglutaminase-like domain-containing protein n=1 Tax=Tissierella sp. TaxID=41274 RepID=UPI00286170D0|nr:transglutaminase-like domain-containing protein [Tissierella sp.]MDR7855020.1 transglutaminase-like domain-containing protein [Tissierella sp.]
MEDILKFYSEHGIMTNIETMKHMVADIPKNISSIVSIVQNIMLHQHWAERYGVELTDKRNEEPWIRSVEEKLIFLNNRGYNHVLDKKRIEDKILGICRDFSVMAAAFCIEAGIPARARCGFATYFDRGKYIDHWVLEYWNEDERRWVLVDPQLDDFQRKRLDISFNTLDVNDKYFITAPRAWLMCREGELNPDLFGILQYWGYDYLKTNLILDVNSLLKIPMQPWDLWEGYKKLPVSEWLENDFLIMDQLSRYDLNVDDDIETLYTFVQQNDEIRVPKDLGEVINMFE